MLKENIYRLHVDLNMMESQQHSKQFAWKGVDQNQIDRAGELSAATLAQARNLLRQRGIRITQIKAKRNPLLGNHKSVKIVDICFVIRQLATMIAAGIPISQALHIIAKGHDNLGVRRLMLTLSRQVESGTTLSRSLGKHSQYFDRLTISLIRAGEESGKLDTMLDQAASHREKMQQIKRRVKSALSYPLALLSVSILVVILMLLFVIPQFETLFQSYGAELPALTQTIVGASHGFKLHWQLLLFAIIIFVLILQNTYRRSANFRTLIDRLSLRLPIVGKLIKKSIYARFARTLSVVFTAGVPLTQGIKLVGAATSNRHYREAIGTINLNIHAGKSIATSIAASRLFPDMMLQMIASGEQSGNLEIMLEKVAQFYESEVDESLNVLSSLIEPLIIVLLGSMIATVVLAMYLPIFKMASVF